jgi:expansin (peptidoglycan-binding protein)
MSTSAGGQFVYVAERYVAGRDGGLDLPAEVSAVLGVE